MPDIRLVASLAGVTVAVGMIAVTGATVGLRAPWQSQTTSAAAMASASEVRPVPPVAGPSALPALTVHAPSSPEGSPSMPVASASPPPAQAVVAAAATSAFAPAPSASPSRKRTEDRCEPAHERHDRERDHDDDDDDD